jgi:hypothetical protein
LSCTILCTNNCFISFTHFPFHRKYCVLIITQFWGFVNSIFRQTLLVSCFKSRQFPEKTIKFYEFRKKHYPAKKVLQIHLLDNLVSLDI